MAPKSIYQLHLEDITKTGVLSRENLDDVLLEIGKRITNCLDIGRVNIWLFDDTKESIKCIGNYNAQDKTFSKGKILIGKDMPIYYRHLLTDEILVINDVYSDSRALDLLEVYCKPLNIYSMMDVPIHIAGKLAGVICYEQIGENRVWTDEEQYFALTINQIVSLAIETRKRRFTQLKLEKSLQEKEVLLAEMHHRIKNNLSTLISLLRMQSNESNNKEYKLLAADFENRIFSIAKIHEQLYTSNNYENISLKIYLEQLVSEFNTSNAHVKFDLDLEDYWIKTEHIVPIGLICNEIIINAMKHAFIDKSKKPEITIELKKLPDGNHLLAIEDNGCGFDKEQAKKTSPTFGLSLVIDLVEQINGKVNVTTSNEGTSYQLILQN